MMRQGSKCSPEPEGTGSHRERPCSKCSLDKHKHPGRHDTRIVQACLCSGRRIVSASTRHWKKHAVPLLTRARQLRTWVNWVKNSAMRCRSLLWEPTTRLPLIHCAKTCSKLTSLQLGVQEEASNALPTLGTQHVHFAPFLHLIRGYLQSIKQKQMEREELALRQGLTDLLHFFLCPLRSNCTSRGAWTLRPQRWQISVRFSAAMRLDHARIQWAESCFYMKVPRRVDL